jgi:polysaccharide export outer membrane protein
MRLLHPPILLLAMMTLAGCARDIRPQVAVATPVLRSDLDALMYGGPGPTSRTAVRVAQAMPEQAMPEKGSAFATDDGPYTIDSGDKLRIVVFNQDTLSNTYSVNADGGVSMPLIGMVQARGLTATQLSVKIAAQLKQGVVRDPSVSVEIETYRPFFILGEVQYPGQYPYVPNMTAEKAIAIAGGFTPRASRRAVTVTRAGLGSPTTSTLPLSQPLRAGDAVTVSERWF